MAASHRSGHQSAGPASHAERDHGERYERARRGRSRVAVDLDQDYRQQEQRPPNPAYSRNVIRLAPLKLREPKRWRGTNGSGECRSTIVGLPDSYMGELDHYKMIVLPDSFSPTLT